MLTSLRAIGNGLLVAGLLGLLAGFAPLFYTTQGTMPAAVFSIYGEAPAPDPTLPGAEIAALSADSTHSESTALAPGSFSFTLSVIQATSIYLLLLAAVILIVLELAELKYLRALMHERKRRGLRSWFVR